MADQAVGLAPPAGPLEVIGVPVGADNYVWLVAHPDGTAGVVDPTAAGPVIDRLRREGLTPAWVFCTHHHGDHVGGNDGIVAAFPGCVVYGSAYDVDAGRVPLAARGLRDGDTLALSSAVAVVRDVPGHTQGHVALHFEEARLAFVGDTLFVGGCGRLLEGTAAQLDASLHDVIARWHPSTRLYCAHEYTVSNLRFAASVLPDDPAVGAALAAATAARAGGEATVPTTVARETATNPFLRLYDPRIRSAVGADDGTPRHEVFARLRAAKDGFR